MGPAGTVENPSEYYMAQLHARDGRFFSANGGQ